MSRVLVTGGTGFIGRHLVAALIRARHHVVLASRQRPEGCADEPGKPAWVEFDLSRPQDLDAHLLQGIDCIFHLAARVHVMKASPGDEERFSALNAHATRILAATAANAGVRRFVFLSSVKVNGECTGVRAFTPEDPPAPQDAYGRSKLAAERALLEVATGEHLDAVIIRPPLVYGDGVGANFRRLIGLVDAGLPLPLGSVKNRRSLVSVWNLVDLMLTAAASPQAAGKVWLVSDGDDVSTPRLLQLIAAQLGKRTRQINVPVAILRALGGIVGMRAEVARLVESLQVNISATQDALGWRPPVTLDEGIIRTVAWYKAARNVG